ncbi:MAG TPA: EamA family transporter [Magnetovibrio sp.]
MNPGLLGLIAALCWGVGDFAARFTSRAIGPMQTLMMMAAVSAMALTPLALKGNIALLWETETLALTVVGALTTTLAGVLLFKSLAQGPLGLVVPVTSSYPVPLVLVVMLMGELTLTIALALAIAATIGGVWVVARAGRHVQYHDDHARGSVVHSMLLAGAAAVIFAIAILLTHSAVSRAGEAEVLWLSRIIGFVALGVVLLIKGNAFSALSLRMTLLLAAMGVVDVIGFLALFTAQGAGDTAIASVASAAYGVVTVGLGRVVLKEPVKPLQWFGFAMVVAGAATLTLLSSQ